MRQQIALVLGIFVILMLACGLPGAATPTALPLPATEAPATSAPATEAPAASAPFTGTWSGPDPDDGSVMILTLVQTGDTLEGTYSDSYTTTITPPGWEGTVAGSVLSPTSAQMTMQLSRHDAKNLVVQANLALSDPNTLMATITSATTAGPWVLTRQ